MIESVLLTNTNTQQFLVINQEDSEFVLDEIDLGTVSGTHHSYKYINQIGVYIDSTSLEQRSISITGWVIGNSYEELEINRKLLNHMINPTHTISVAIKSIYEIKFKPDFSVQYSTAKEENNEVLCKFLIQGTCADPLFTTRDKQFILIASTIPKFRFPLVIPKSSGIILGLREPSLLATVNNDGDVDTGLLITFSCTSTVTHPSLLNVDTREFIKLNTSISPGDKITISTSAGEKYIKGLVNGTEQNFLKYMDFDSSWLQLHTGVNIFKYDADDNPNGLEVSISFLPRYLEVQ